MQSDRPLPDGANLLRMWKNWEHGKHRPRPEYQRLIATTFGRSRPRSSVPRSSARRHGAEPELLVPAADDTLELVERIRHSDLDRASLDTLTITVERLCSEYSYMPSVDLRREGQAWMVKLVQPARLPPHPGPAP